MSEPLVSVIIPAYKSAKYLREALGSIVNQTYRNLEIFIIDDTPEDDGTENIIAGFNDGRVHHIKPEQRLGLVKSLNYGIELSNGGYIARMDADDISHPERVKKQVQYMESHLDVGVVGCNAYSMDESGKVNGERVFPEDDCELKTKMCFNSSLNHPTVMARTELLKRNLYDESCFCCEDYELWTRLMPCTKFYNFQERLFKYRVFKDSAMATQLQRIKTDDQYYEKHLSVMKKVYGNIGNYLGVDLLDLNKNYADLIFAKRLDDFSFNERKDFLQSYSRCIVAKIGKNDYSRKCFAYQWIKMTGKSFWKTTDVRMAISAIEVAISFEGGQLMANKKCKW